MRKFIITFFVLFVLGLASYIFTNWYSYIFARHVQGKIAGVERVTDPNAIINTGGQIPPNLIFSFAVAIQTSSGEIVTASTEDRQWAVVEKGQCAEAEYFPYPPWDFDKRGTYYGARLLKLYDCP